MQNGIVILENSLAAQQKITDTDKYIITRLQILKNILLQDARIPLLDSNSRKLRTSVPHIDLYAKVPSNFIHSWLKLRNTQKSINSWTDEKCDTLIGKEATQQKKKKETNQQIQWIAQAGWYSTWEPTLKFSEFLQTGLGSLK